MKYLLLIVSLFSISAGFEYANAANRQAKTKVLSLVGWKDSRVKLTNCGTPGGFNNFKEPKGTKVCIGKGNTNRRQYLVYGNKLTGWKTYEYSKCSTGVPIEPETGKDVCTIREVSSKTLKPKGKTGKLEFSKLNFSGTPIVWWNFKVNGQEFGGALFDFNFILAMR